MASQSEIGTEPRHLTCHLGQSATIGEFYMRNRTDQYHRTNGIALANGNAYWGIKSSHRYHFVSQQALVSNLTDSELGAQVAIPGTFPSEGAGYTADE